MRKADKRICREYGLMMGVTCAAFFALPALFCAGKAILVSLVGVPLGFVIGGILGYVIAALKQRRDKEV